MNLRHPKNRNGSRLKFGLSMNSRPLGSRDWVRISCPSRARARERGRRANAIPRSRARDEPGNAPSRRPTRDCRAKTANDHQQLGEHVEEHQYPLSERALFPINELLRASAGPARRGWPVRTSIPGGLRQVAGFSCREASPHLFARYPRTSKALAAERGARDTHGCMSGISLERRSNAAAGS